MIGFSSSFDVGGGEGRKGFGFCIRLERLSGFF